MSERDSVSPTEAAGAAPQAVSVEAGLESPAVRVGIVLREAREARKLPAQELARLLKLSPHQVHLIETGDAKGLRGNTIFRGFVRNYAKQVGLDPAVIMEMLGQSEAESALQHIQSPVGTRISGSYETKARRRDYVKVLVGGVILAFAVLAYFFIPEDLWQSTVNRLLGKNTVSVGALSPRDTLPEERSVSNTPPESRQELQVSPVPVSPTAIAAATPEGVTPPANGALDAPKETGAGKDTTKESGKDLAKTKLKRLKFSFKQNAWVEVRGKNQEILFSMLNPAGTAREVEGVPPFSLVIGNAQHVTLEYQGKLIDLSKRSRENVARLTLD